MIRDDYVLRQIQKAIEAIARAFRHQAAADPDQAIEQIQQAYSDLLEHNLAMMDVVDPETLARLVGSHAKVRALAQLSLADGELRQAGGDEAAARRAFARAHTLARIANEGDPRPDDSELLARIEQRL